MTVTNILKTIKIGYFGTLDYLNNQVEFAEVFGDKPTNIPLNPVTLKGTTTEDRSLYEFGKKSSWMSLCIF